MPVTKVPPVPQHMFPEDPRHSDPNRAPKENSEDGPAHTVPENYQSHNGDDGRKAN